jgi:hypothetical protein
MKIVTRLSIFGVLVAIIVFAVMQGPVKGPVTSTETSNLQGLQEPVTIQRYT